MSKSISKELLNSFLDLIVSREFYNAYSIILNNSNLASGVPLENLDLIIAYAKPWLPSEDRVDLFCDFLDIVYFEFNDKNLSFNLAYSLSILYPKSFSANLLFARMCLDRRLIHLSRDPLLNALRLNPDDSDANSIYGKYLSINNDHEGARHYFERAGALDPENYKAFYNLAECFMQLGDIDKYKYNLRESLRIKPTYIIALFSKAQFELHHNKNVKEFIDIKNKISRIDPDNPLNYLLSAYHQMYLGLDGDAYLEKYAEKSMAKGEMPPDIRAIITNDKDIDSLLEILDVVHDDKSKNAIYLSQKGSLLLEKGNIVEAEKNLKAALEIDPRDVNTNIKYISSLLILNRIDEAEELCLFVRKISPYSISPLLFLSVIYLKRNNIIDAAESINRVISKEQNNLDAMFLKALCLYKESNYKDALSYSSKSLEEGDIVKMFLHAKILFADHKNEEAICYFNKIIECPKRNAGPFVDIKRSAYYMRSHALFRIGNTEAAIKSIKKACHIRVSEYLLNDLAVFLAKKGRLLRAAHKTKKAIRVNPNVSIIRSNHLTVIKTIRIRTVYHSVLLALLFGIWLLGKNKSYYFMASLVIITFYLIIAKKIKPGISIQIGEGSLSFSLGEISFDLEEKYVSLRIALEESNVLK